MYRLFYDVNLLMYLLTLQICLRWTLLSLLFFSQIKYPLEIIKAKLTLNCCVKRIHEEKQRLTEGRHLICVKDHA